jgi:hypothetical protein
MSELDWKFYLNDNPAVAGCGFIAEAPYKINNCRTKAFVGINTRDTDDKNENMPEISYVAAIGNIWKLADKEMSRDIYLFDDDGDVRLHGVGFGRFENGPIKLSREDYQKFENVINDLKEYQPVLEKGLDCCVSSLMKFISDAKL